MMLQTDPREDQIMSLQFQTVNVSIEGTERGPYWHHLEIEFLGGQDPPQVGGGVSLIITLQL